MVSAILIVSLLVAALAAALGGAYVAGLLDDAIEYIAVYVFKAKAKAEVSFCLPFPSCGCLHVIGLRASETDIGVRLRRDEMLHVAEGRECCDLR